MIKSFKKFNEGKKDTLYFPESDEYEEVMSKYMLDDDEVDDFFLDLKDEREISTQILGNQLVSDITKNSFKIQITISFKKQYSNQKRSSRNHIDYKDYYKFLSEQLEDIKSIQDFISRFTQNEKMTIEINELSKLPFQGAGANAEEYGSLSAYIICSKIIRSSEMYDAKQVFDKKDNPFKKALDEVAHELSNYGVKKEDALQLLDIHPGYDEMEDVDIGFSTNEEIITVAYVSKTHGDISYLDDEMTRAAEEYSDGQCSDFL